jgi:lauroyl/myristoyl acyltransferase
MGLKQKVMSAMIDRLELKGVPHILAVEQARRYWKEKHEGVVTVANKHNSLMTTQVWYTSRERRYEARHPELFAFKHFWELVQELYPSLVEE